MVAARDPVEENVHPKVEFQKVERRLEDADVTLDTEYNDTLGSKRLKLGEDLRQDHREFGLGDWSRVERRRE